MNALVNYIQTHENWREELSNAPYHLSIKDNGPYTIFNYNQIKSDMSLPEVQVARGIILKITEEESEHVLVNGGSTTKVEVVSQRFPKFFNYGESLAAEIDWSTARVTEKCDGCLDAETQIETPQGFKSIQELSESHYRGQVRSKDLSTGEIVWDTVIADSIQEESTDWYEVVLEDGRSLKLTGNHRIWLPELRCWRRVDELDGTEKVDVL